MSGRLRVTRFRHRCHHAGERSAGGHVAVDDGEGFAVVSPDADLEPDARRATVIAAAVDVDDPADLETADLAGDHAVLDDDGSSGGVDVRDDGEV